MFQLKNRAILILWVAIVFVGIMVLHGDDANREAITLPVADDFRIDSWTTEEGLPENSVSFITQTADGFLWIATGDGVARFDGVRFAVFNRSNTPELTRRRFSRLLPGRDGGLWILSEDGALFRFAAGKMRGFGEADGLPAAGCSALREDSAGNLWVTSAIGARCFKFEGDRFSQVADLSNWTGGSIWQLERDTDGTLWGLAGGELFRLHPGLPQKISDHQISGNTNVLVDMKAPPGGGLWLTSGEGSLAYPVASHKTFDADSSRKLAQDFNLITFAGEKTIWGSKQSGLKQELILAGTNGSIKRITTRARAENEHISAVFPDSEGNIWFGIQGMGLFRAKQKSFHSITTADGMTARIVRSVTADTNGVIWAVTPSGVNRIFPEAPMRISSPKFSVPLIWSALGTTSGKVWMGTFGLGVYEALPNSLQESRPEGRRVEHVATALFQDSTGDLWRGSDHDLVRITRTNVTPFPFPPNLPNADVRAIAEGLNQVHYVGLRSGGLLREQNGQVTRFTVNDGLGDDSIGALYADAEDTLWIGTMGKGLTRLKAGRCQNLGMAQSLLPASITAILEDDLGSLWLASNTGVYRVSRSELNRCADNGGGDLNVQRYGKTDGMSSSECYGGVQPSAWKTPDGRLWFGTSDGLSMVDPRNLQFNAKPPRIYIDRVKVDNEVELNLETDSQTGLQKVVAPPGVSRLEVHYTALCFTAPEKMTIRYRLEGGDSKWINAQGQRIAYYTRLAPGDYRFQVAACNNDGVWNDADGTLDIRVQPFYWQTGWFRFGMVIFGIGLLAGAQEFRIRKLREVQRLRGQIASDLHDEIGSNLGSMALLADRAVRKARADEAGEWSKVHGIAQETAQSMREIVWFANPDFDTLPEMVDRMRDTAAQFLPGMALHFEAPEPVPNLKLSLERRKNIFLIYKELLHNIAKHSRAKEVSVTLTIEKGSLKLQVADDGAGLPSTENSCVSPRPDYFGGNGCRNIRKRAAALGGSVAWNSQPGRGVRVELIVPSL